MLIFFVKNLKIRKLKIITNQVQKLLTLHLLVIIAALLGGMYGIIHDQFTYTISPEYYTKFKFYQFGLMDVGNEAIFPNPRFQVSIVGFLATWWMGLLIGFILGLFGLAHNGSKHMFWVTLKAIMITMLVTIVIGLIGLAYGKIFLINKELGLWFPENLLDKNSFIMVGSMHNFGYLGGFIGLVVGIIYSLHNVRNI